MYIPLHVHDEDASIGDSILNLEDYVNLAKTYGLPALAITNHGSLASMYKFYKLCKKQNIKAIIGNEMYLSLDDNEALLAYADADTNTRKKITQQTGYKPSGYFHLVLLAQNRVGFHNLLYLTSYSATQTFYGKPLITEEVLKQHAEGLICLTACVQGLIPQMILQDQPSEAIQKKILDYAELFKGRFYLELQPCCFQEQIKVNMHLARYAELLNLPVVATNDVHYLKPEDALAHNVHVADSRNKKVSIEDELIYRDNCFYLMQEKDLNLLGVSQAVQQKAVAHTVQIAESCEDLNLPQQVQMPVFDSKLSPAQRLKLLYQIAVKKLNHLMLTVREPYIYSERLMYELSVIEKLGFVDYFLIIWDVYRYAKEEQIAVGPGRGSVAGSLLAYCLDVTKIDPIKYHLIFERFLSEYRIGSVPDIDVDACSSKRDLLFQYVQNKYGYDHCAQVSTQTVRKAKSAIKDAARILHIKDYIEVGQKIADLIPNTYYDEEGEKVTDLDIRYALELIPRLRQYQTQYPDLFHFAIALQHKPKNSSIHAAGILIFPEKLQDYLPLRLSKNALLPATSLNLKDAENVAIKFDFLGLRTLDMLENISKNCNFSFDYENDNLYNDEATWNLLGTQYNAGIFQVSSYTYQKRMCRLKPHTIEELAACLALVRGPCISTGLDEKFMQIREGLQTVEKIHPIYDEATSDTYGVMIYQEQSMKLFQNAGLSSEDSFRLMKLLGKKKLDEAKVYKDAFYQKCTEKGVPLKIIDYIWELTEASSLYSFNKSHAIGYALVTFASAYYKAHYPKAFFTALATHLFESSKNPIEKTQVLNGMMKELKAYGYKVIVPDVNCCQTYCLDIPETNNIMLGTCAIKNFSSSALELMQQYAPIQSMADLFGTRLPYGSLKTKKACEEQWKAVPIAPKISVVAGIFAGLFDAVYGHKKTRFQIYEDYMALRKQYCANTSKETITDTITIAQQLTVKKAQPNRSLEKTIYGIYLN